MRLRRRAAPPTGLLVHPAATGSAHRTRSAASLLASVVLAAAGSSRTTGADRPDSARPGAAALGVGECDDPVDPTTRSPAEVPATQDGPESLSLHVNSSFPRPVELTVRFDDRVALDAELPGVVRGCRVEPLYRYAYERPPGPLTVTASAGARTATETIPAEAGRRWIVILLQPGFGLEMEVWRTEPQWPG